MIDKPTVNGTNGIMLDVSCTFLAKLRNRLVSAFQSETETKPQVTNWQKYFPLGPTRWN